jgi:hypothetical protein
MRKILRLLILVPVAIWVVSTAQAHEQIPAGRINGNMKARLIASRVSETRGQYLIALFKPLEKSDGEEIEVSFPAHSLTAHETTIHVLVVSCTASGQPLTDRPKPPFPARPWRASTIDAVFSLPKDRMKYRGYDWLENCFLVSLKPVPQ